MDEFGGLETRSLHAGQVPDAETLSRAVPIYQTTSFMFRDTAHAADLFALDAFGNIYTRLMNPTTDVLEKRLAALHGGTAACATASGMAAIFATIATLARAGQNVVAGSNLYGGTHTLFQHQLPRFGIEVRFVDSSDPDNFAAAADENTRLLYTESVGNPRCNVDDFEGIARVAGALGIPFVVDNTFTPPPLFDPFSHGADLIVYSLTKMIGGHGTSIGGAVVERGDFDWPASGKFPDLAGPDPAYHDMNFWEKFGNHDDAVARGMAFALKVKTGALRDFGACLSPFNSFLFLQGLETLPLRAHRHAENAATVASFLAGHPAVEWVNYAGLPDHADHARAKRYFPHGPGAVFGFGVKGGLEAGRCFIENVRLASHLANVLDAKTLVIHPASTTHQQLSETEQRDAGVSPEMIRISVGLETVDDILADLDQALRVCGR